MNTVAKITIDGIARQVSTAVFDYSPLDADAATHARAAAGRIRRRNHNMVEAIIENGSDLLGMKERLAHGQFEAWVIAECGIAERTARNYMAAARTFASKTATVADLSPTTLYALTSLRRFLAT